MCYLKSPNLLKGVFLMITLGEAWEFYLNSKTCKPENLRKEINRYNNHVGGYWPKQTKLSEITTSSLMTYKKHLESCNLKPQSIKHCLTLIKAIINRAVKFELYDGKIPYCEMPKINNARVRYLTEDEAFFLLQRLSIRSELWHDISLLALNTGLRAGEIFAIRKTAINFQQKTITIFESKNSLSRIINLNEIAFNVLLKYSMEKYKFFFSDKEIKYVSSVYFESVKYVNLNDNITDSRDKVVFHTLRHTFASWLIQSGVPIETVRYLLGHKNIQMTIRYAHLAPCQGQQAVSLLPKNYNHFFLHNNKEKQC